MASMLNASMTMNFKVPAVMAGWTLAEAMNEHVLYSKLKEDPTIPVGEYYEDALKFK